MGSRALDFVGKGIEAQAGDMSLDSKLSIRRSWWWQQVQTRQQTRIAHSKLPEVWYYSISDMNMKEGAGSGLSKASKFVEAESDSPLEMDPSSNTQVLLNNIPLVSCAIAQKKKKKKAHSVVKTSDPIPNVVDTIPKTPQNNVLVEAVQSTPIPSDDHVLQPKHKIFLSHSGVQKDFVEELCEDLEKRHHFPFFDKRPLSLPKGERFPKLILDAAKQCRMAVVVVSNDYFVSRWPMIELHEFVQALESTNTKLRILPLFYGLSVAEFCEPTRQEEWFRLWDDWAEVDKRVNVKGWKYALKVLRSFNGIEYKQFMKNGAAYRSTIVSNICLVIPPDIKWDDSHVQGRSNLCEEIFQKIQQIGPSPKYKACVVGIYGVGGIGKTTVGKTLCNELSNEYDGKVFQVEFGSQSHHELLKGVLKKLTNVTPELLKDLDERKCINILRNDFSRQKSFLVVDNVWDDSESVEKAKVYLQASSHKQSLLMVMGRSLSTLELLGIDEGACLEMPELDKEDAMRLFLFHAADGKQYENHEDIVAIENCVAHCYFQKGDKRGYHFLPLALKSLGVQLGTLGDNPLEWVKNLPDAKDFNFLDEIQNPLFSILKSSYDKLKPADQCLFMDVGLYMPFERHFSSLEMDFMEWLCFVHKQKEHEIQNGLLRLKKKALLEDVDIRSRVSMHDLYHEFALLESEGKSDASAHFETRKWVYIKKTDPSELENKPSGRCWQNLVRIGITEDFVYPANDSSSSSIPSMAGIKWKYFSNLVVLKLTGLKDLGGVMNLKGLSCLRSLTLLNIWEVERIDGLEDLNNLAYFNWCVFRAGFDYPTVGYRSSVVGQFPRSLKVLHVSLGLVLKPDALTRCTNLCKLELLMIHTESLDFSNCTSLQSVKISYATVLRSLTGLVVGCQNSLQSLTINHCYDLIEIPGIDQLARLRRLELNYCYELKELPDLQRLSGLQVSINN